ncbi:MAG: hydrogenase [Methanomicrobiales archaeon]|nr:hydrogenase [Methanomicrobiales archaeon]NYT20655.1 hydrogenase [Methanomicrobiales archaeon]
MDLFASLTTGTGFWNPLAWLIAVIAATVIVYLILQRGEPGYKKGTAQTTPFISGNPEPGKEMVHVRASNLYWGYLDALKGYYDLVVPAHTGVVNDYVLWYLGVTAALMIVVVVFI